jgi:hypothetical protein
MQVLLNRLTRQRAAGMQQMGTSSASTRAMSHTGSSSMYWVADVRIAVHQCSLEAEHAQLVASGAHGHWLNSWTALGISSLV